MRHGIRTNKHLSFETAKSGLGKDCQGKGSFCCGTGTPSHRQGTRPWAKTKRVNHQGKYPNLVLVHGPVHASWLNQIEIYFSIIQRKVLTPNDFSSRQELADRLLAFERHYETIARPFEWRFTRHDLTRLLRRLGHPAVKAA